MKISYYLPEQILKNEELAQIYPEWTAEKIYKKTGISSRHISDKAEFVSDMAVKAAEKLLAEYNINRSEIDFLILVTQNPDYALPTTACIVQDRLGLNKRIGAFDINLGCSGFIYGLSTAKAMVLSGTAKKALLITAEQYSKRIHPMDKSIRTIFGDGAAAVLIDEETVKSTGEFVFGTDGSGHEKLIAPASGTRGLTMHDTDKESTDASNNTRSPKNIFMDGSEIFNFTIDVVPPCFDEILEKNNAEKDNIALYVFHQANKFMLDFLMKHLKIPKEKFYVNMETTGNTVSSSIPIALKTAELEGKLKRGDKIMIMGFGVGLSWGGTIISY